MKCLLGLNEWAKYWKETLIFISYIIQGVVGFIVWVYTRETQKLRVASEKQVEIGKQQALQGISPYLSADVVKVIPETYDFEQGYTMVNEYFDGIKSQPHNLPNIRYQLAVEMKQPRFICLVRNHTAKVAIHVHLWVCDLKTQRFYHSNSGLDVLGEKVFEYFIPVEPSLTIEEVKKGFISEYGSDAWPKSFKSEEGRYVILLMYRDTEEHTHCVIRHFNIIDGNIARNRSNKLYPRYQT